MSEFIAHIRDSDKTTQALFTHLLHVAVISQKNAEKIGFGQEGYLVGLLHDIGKYSAEFQQYIKSNSGFFDADDVDLLDVSGKKGKIDHSTAGSQLLWEKYKAVKGGKGELCAQILSLCIASHHSGLINILALDGASVFLKRMTKSKDLTYENEVIANADEIILNLIESKLDNSFLSAFFKKITKIIDFDKVRENYGHPSKEDAFQLGLLSRFLYSSLIDADRQDSADFESPQRLVDRNLLYEKFSWNTLIQSFENAFTTFTTNSSIDRIRKSVADTCKKRAADDQGIYTLSVPTGGGKTFSSLRFALHHAKKHKLDHIIFVIPFTSIIEQNAEAVRSLLPELEELILEHHSNLEPDKQSWHSKLAAENWDSPIIFTTMVQFLETLFAGGSSKARRMHQLAQSVIVFDEIQTLPLSCTHLFCLAMNFFVEHAKTTAVLCTATQPVLDKLSNKEGVTLKLAQNNELASNLSYLFTKLERVKIINNHKIGGWSQEEITDFIIDKIREHLNCLVIVNTKKWAKTLYHSCKECLGDEFPLYHLSTDQYPQHRRDILHKVKTHLKRHEAVLCISTQLIEAGVDIDFSSVIRFSAGLDSIAQAAGRCNRNGTLNNGTGKGSVFVINPREENLQSLKAISVGKDMFMRISDEFSEEEFLYPQAITQYFQYFFFDRNHEMNFPIKNSSIDLVNMLSTNSLNNGNCNRERFKNGRVPMLQQSFMDAGKIFKAIDAPTESVIVQHSEGVQIVADLCSLAKEYQAENYYKTIKKAQMYSINMYPNIMERLLMEGAVSETQKGEGIFYLRSEYYSDNTGLLLEPTGESLGELVL